MVPNRSVRFGLPAAIAVALLLVLPAAASAADTYADASALDNSGDCLTPVTPCRTIGGVDGALSKSGAGDTTFVADGTYAESITLADGKSLLSLDATDPRPLIDNGADPSPAITINAGGAGTVSGFTIRSDYVSMQVNGTVNVDDNVFDEESVPVNSGSDINVTAGASVVITDNVFVDPDAAGLQFGLQIDSADTPAPVVSDNAFTDLAAGVLVLAGTPTVARNTFSAAAASPVAGVYLEATAPGVPTGATLSRNRISGADVGVEVIDSSAPVTLSNDLIYDNTTGIESTDTGLDSPPSTQGDISATNATIVDNTVDARVSFTTLTLDSTIVGTPVDLVGGNGACDISFSRGPTTAGTSCEEFDTNAGPLFADPPTGDYHLQSTSTLIDVGNPADPGPGAVDFYGATRKVQGAACNAVRRDIGASEFQPGSQPQCAQTTYADVSRPDDDADCITQATACKSIAAALSKSADDQTTLVADGTYDEELVVDQGKSLVSLDTSDPRPIIDTGTDTGATAIRIEGAGAGTISGFRIRSDGIPMLIQDSTAEVEDNVFDEDSVPAENADLIISGGTGIAVHDNLFEDPDAGGLQFGVSVIENPTGAVISDNTFTDLTIGTAVSDEGAQVIGNEFTGARAPGPALPGVPGAGVLVFNGTPVITSNTFSAPASHPAAGIYITRGGPSYSAGATLSRNRISGGDVGVQVVDSDAPVTLSNDLIYDNTVGLESTDTSADSPTPSDQGDVSATNATIFDNAVDVQVSFTTATLNSTILGAPIDFVGNGVCSISYSRGSSSPSANGCGDFATTADPQFVNAAAGDFHLQSSSPMIDVGDPASPGGGPVDFYGGPRALHGKACSTVRRDIGAAEYDPGTTPECIPPPQPAPAPPTDPPPAPPKPTIDERPPKRTTDRTPTFEFSNEMPGVTFRCRLDRRVWKACTPPVTYRRVRYGKHRFKVQAISPSGKRSRIKAVFFRVVRRG